MNIKTVKVHGSNLTIESDLPLFLCCCSERTMLLSSQRKFDLQYHQCPLGKAESISERAQCVQALNDNWLCVRAYCPHTRGKVCRSHTCLLPQD